MKYALTLLATMLLASPVYAGSPASPGEVAKHAAARDAKIAKANDWGAQEAAKGKDKSAQVAKRIQNANDAYNHWLAEH